MNRTRHGIALALSFTVCATAAGLTGQDNYRAKAFAAADAGDVRRAADLFFRLFKSGADDREVLATGARCLERTGRYNDALDVLSRGAKKFPKDPTFRVGLARVYNLKAARIHRDSGKLDSNVVFNYQDAIREARKALIRWPANRDARLILANSHYSIGEWDLAKKQADKLIERFPEHPGGYIILGDLAFEHFKVWQRKLRGKDADTSKATMMKIVGSREAASQSYEKAIELDKNRVVAHRKLGDLYAWNYETKKALAKYVDALRIDPSTAVNHGWIAKNTDPEERYRMYERLGREYMARPDAVKAKSAVFAWWGAAALIAAKKFALGEELYAYSVTLDPRYTNAYYYAMYSAFFYREDEMAAIAYAAKYAHAAPIEFADIVRAIPAEPREKVTQLVRFLAKRAMDKGVASASRDLNHVLAAIVDTADAWNNFAFMARESGEFVKAEAAYRNALEIEPKSGQLMNDLAVVLHYHKGTPKDLAEAESLYKRAIAAAHRVLRTAKSTAEEKAAAKQTVSDASGNLKLLTALRKAKAGSKTGKD